MQTKRKKPVIRWAGGKYWLVDKLRDFVPQEYKNYYEPFLGGGTIFFNLEPKSKSYLSDTNSELINAFQQIKENIDDLIFLLKKFNNTKEMYYEVRDHFTETDNLSRAARFLFLNRTSFNGIWRVNLSGRYNVPYGFKTYKNLFEYERLQTASKLLASSNLRVNDFEEALNFVEQGDFVFLDPPYTVAHGNNGFVKYNEKIFSWNDQKRLAKTIKKIKEVGAFYVLTNAKHSSTYELFSSIDEPISISRKSVIGGKNAKRQPVEEYLFSNVDLTGHSK